MPNKEAELFVIKYVEIAGTDPAKIVAACESLGIKASEVGPAAPISAAAGDDQPAKRGPGRPPKQKEEDEAEAEAPPKKRRGRPPKKKTDDDEPDEAPARRKRGRPSTKAADDVPKRKRGRPPKKKEEDDLPPKRRAAEPPDDDDDDEGDDGDAAPTYVDIVKHLKTTGPRRIGDIVEELYLEFGWENARDIAQVLKSVRQDDRLEDEDFWVVLERICPTGDEDDWLDLLEEKIAPHLEEAMGAAEEAENGD